MLLKFLEGRQSEEKRKDKQKTLAGDVQNSIKKSSMLEAVDILLLMCYHVYKLLHALRCKMN